MNIAQDYFDWRKSFAPFTQAAFAEEVNYPLRTIKRWLAGTSAPGRAAAEVIERKIELAEESHGAKMPRN